MPGLSTDLKPERCSQTTGRSHCLRKMGIQVTDEFPSGKVHGYPDLEQETATANVLYPAQTLAGSCREWKVSWCNHISQDLQWTNHIHTTIGEATRKLGFLRRNLGQCTSSAKATAYCTLIRPAIEYVSSVWDPHQATLTREVEQVQRRAARFVYNNYRDTSTRCVTRLLHQLEWDSLQHRRTI